MKVTVNGRDAPLFALANVSGQEQVNFQTPWETEGSAARVTVTREGSASPSVDVAVAALQPGIFELNSAGAIVVRTADNSLVTALRPYEPASPFTSMRPAWAPAMPTRVRAMAARAIRWRVPAIR